MTVGQRFPAGPPIAVEQLVAEARSASLSVGDDRVRDFLAALSRRLLRPEVTRRHPELGALGFFLRRGELARLLDDLADGRLRFPRGLVFHIPPANVDTVFVYSWALSALAGNANLVRLSARGGGASEAIREALDEALEQADPVIARTQRLIAYDRSDAITTALSAACDLRVIWGGDAAVDAIRRYPLRPWARDLTFPDRSSFAAISISGWLASSGRERQRAADAFVNDAYWFDQAACSSPRTIFWVGAAAPGVREEFERLVAGTAAARGFTADAAMAVQKRVAAYGLAAEGSATAISFHSNTLATIELADTAPPPRHWLGAGTFAHTTVPALPDLVRYVDRKDQTLSTYGFTAGELRDFAVEVGGRGIDRIVPFGSALTFSAVWDGYDLLREFTRLTTITS